MKTKDIIYIIVLLFIVYILYYLFLGMSKAFSQTQQPYQPSSSRKNFWEYLGDFLGNLIKAWMSNKNNENNPNYNYSGGYV